MCQYKKYLPLRVQLGDLHASRDLGAAEGHAAYTADTLSFSSLLSRVSSLKWELEGVPALPCAAGKARAAGSSKMASGGHVD